MGMLVRDIHDEVKSVTPGAIISVAAVSNPIAPRSRRASIQGQVAWEWLDQGWIDASFVTVYSADTQGVVDKIRAVRQAVQSECRRSSVFPGLAVYDLDSKEERASLVVEQVNAVMRGQWTGQPLEPPARGVALFRATRFGEAAISGLADAPFIEAAQPFWGETVPNSAAPNSPGNQ